LSISKHGIERRRTHRGGTGIDRDDRTKIEVKWSEFTKFVSGTAWISNIEKHSEMIA
jgi:hypothetical protein